MENVFKTAKRPPVKKKKVRDNRKNSARERSAKFEGANNAPVAIYMAATVGLFWFFDILFFSHSSTTWPEGFESTQFVWHKLSSEIS